MIEISKIILVTRNARDKVNVAIASLSQEGNAFYINRATGQHGGKMSEQPELIIEKGKAKRSVIQQAELEFNSIINKYLDKGYKKLDSLTKNKYEELTISELNILVPSIKSDQNGEMKPMLAKDYNKCENSVLNNSLYASTKLNGVRCMMRFKDSEVISISRGGKDYNVSTELIRKELYKYLKENQNIILDGELYLHNNYLQDLAGIAKLKTWDDRCNILQYHIYDICDGKLIFSERLKILENLKEIFKNSQKIFVLEHTLTNSWLEIKQLHDKWVSEGYEGVVVRKLDKVYAFGKRGSDMIKIKAYQEDEFEIIDYSEKLREEDFCFICQTKDGNVFEAKPIGSRELKKRYIEDIDNIIGKMGTVKYFEISKDGIPMQPIFQAVRDYE